jgi:type IV pilus assembly protein PilO
MNKLKALFEQLRNLDPNDPGRWPFTIRLGTTVLLLVLAAGAGYYWFVWKAKRPELLEARAKETELWTTLETKAKKAANLQAYKDQLAEMEKSFGAMLRQLPNKTEVPNLLVDISQSGLAAGLEEKLFQPRRRESQGLLRRAPDPHPAHGRVPRDGRVRERHRGAAENRYVARHRDRSGFT